MKTTWSATFRATPAAEPQSPTRTASPTTRSDSNSHFGKVPGGGYKPEGLEWQCLRPFTFSGQILPLVRICQRDVQKLTTPAEYCLLLPGGEVMPLPDRSLTARPETFHLGSNLLVK